jgi:hypothetical protein
VLTGCGRKIGWRRSDDNGEPKHWCITPVGAAEPSGLSAGWRLKPISLIYNIPQRLAIREGSAIILDDLKPPFVQVRTVSSHVRSHQQIRQAP